MEILQIFGYSLILLLMFTIIIVGMMYQWSLFVTRAPFVCIPKEVAEEIAKALDVKEGSVVYDLGSGDGRVLRACYQKQPKAKYIGIDKAMVAIWYAKFINRGLPIQFRHKNFFKCDLSDATHCYIYLFPGLVNRLLPRLEQQLKPGTRVIACDFYFDHKKPMKEIDLKRPEGVLGRKLYIYEF